MTQANPNPFGSEIGPTVGYDFYERQIDATPLIYKYFSEAKSKLEKNRPQSIFQIPTYVQKKSLDFFLEKLQKLNNAKLEDERLRCTEDLLSAHFRTEGEPIALETRGLAVLIAKHPWVKLTRIGWLANSITKIAWDDDGYVTKVNDVDVIDDFPIQLEHFTARIEESVAMAIKANQEE